MILYDILKINSSSLDDEFISDKPAEDYNTKDFTTVRNVWPEEN